MKRIYLLLLLAFAYAAFPFAQRKSVELPEIIVKSHKNDVLHILAVIRDYSTLTTYNDSVLMYREKLVDFMIPVRERKNFPGWLSPRTLSSKSYYHFSDPSGLDSVSDTYNEHFSWSDWVEISNSIPIPSQLLSNSRKQAIDSLSNPGTVWTRNDDDYSVQIDILANPDNYKYLSRLARFRRDDLDFQTLKIKYNFNDVSSSAAYPHELSDVTYEIESRNRGRQLFRFGRPGDDIFINTRAELYIVDREYISMSEAKKWEKLKFSDLEIDTSELQDELDELPLFIQQLIARVENIDHDALRLNAERDKLLKTRNLVPLTRKQKVLKTLKSLFLH